MGHRSSVQHALAFLVMLNGVFAETGRTATWTEIDAGLPTAPVRVGAIAIARAQPSTIYARTIGPDGVGAIFKTTDGAGSWKALSTVVGVNFLVVDPQNQSTLYAVTGHGLLKSTDGGTSWTAAGAGLSNLYVGILAIDPVTSANLYAVTGGSIFKTTDGGGSWTALNTGLPANSYISSLVIDPSTPSSIYAVAAIPRNGGPSLPAVLKTTDAGATWNLLDNALLTTYSVTSLIAAQTAPSVLYAISPSGPSGTSILKSVDGGESWTQVNTGLPPGADVSSLVIDPADSSTLYLAVDFYFAEAGGILKSTDGGATWTAIKPDLPANSPIDYLAIDPANSATLYMVSEGAIFKSPNGGVSWNKAMAGLNVIASTALAVSRFDASTIYAGASNSLFKSVDGGASWNQLVAFQLFASSVPTFIPSPFPDGSPAYPQTLLLSNADPGVLYTGTSRGNGCYFADNLLFKSSDGGMTWSNSVSPQTSGCVLGGLFAPSAGLKAMDPTDPNTLYVAEADDEDGGWSLLKTSDGGANWISFGSFPNQLQAGVWALAIDPSTPSTLYAGVDDVPIYSDTTNTAIPGQGGAFKSTDGGTTWNSIGLTGAAINLLAIDPAQPSVIYAATEGNYGTPRGFRGIFKSTDSGATWSAVNNGLGTLSAIGSSVTAIVIDPSNSGMLYLAVSGGGVFKSSDGGASWSQLNNGLGSLDVRALALAPGSGHTLYAGTSGGIFKINDAP
jgi:photosystem II stability/assembly factor-like uncharacterized protein